MTPLDYAHTTEKAPLTVALAYSLCRVWYWAGFGSALPFASSEMNETQIPVEIQDDSTKLYSVFTPSANYTTGATAWQVPLWNLRASQGRGPRTIKSHVPEPLPPQTAPVRRSLTDCSAAGPRATRILSNYNSQDASRNQRGGPCSALWACSRDAPWDL